MLELKREVNGCQMTEPGASLLRGGEEVYIEARGVARRTHMLMDWMWCLQCELMFNLA